MGDFFLGPIYLGRGKTQVGRTFTWQWKLGIEPTTTTWWLKSRTCNRNFKNDNKEIIDNRLQCNGSLYKEIKFCFISRRWIYWNLFLCFSTSLDVICPHRKRREKDIFLIVLQTDVWTNKVNYSFAAKNISPETVGSWWKISSPGRISCVATRPLPLPGMLVNLNCLKEGS